jgi:tRNA threonylcarbamoyladenosine biosynthesis protein TsaB
LLLTLLNINTAFEKASVNLSTGEKIMAEAESHSQKDHASFLEPAIKKICNQAEIKLNDIDAISVVNGPGSYTGLRVGLSCAKALCYALEKPLILLNTLDVMAMALKIQLGEEQQKGALFCPLIDARRNEVYTALYNYELNLLYEYKTVILSDNFLENERKSNFMVVGGSGSLKLQKISNNKNILYINPLDFTLPGVVLANEAVELKKFSEIIYSEPFYLKPVYFK